MAITRKGKRPITVNGEEFLWKSNGQSVQVCDLKSELNVITDDGLVLVKGRRFRSVSGCGGLHRLFRAPDFFWIGIYYPSRVAEFIRWATEQGPDPEEIDRCGLTGSFYEQSQQLERRERDKSGDRAD